MNTCSICGGPIGIGRVCDLCQFEAVRREHVQRLSEQIDLREKLERQRRERVAQVSPETRRRWVDEAANWGIDLGDDPVIEQAQEMARQREWMEQAERMRQAQEVERQRAQQRVLEDMLRRSLGTSPAAPKISPPSPAILPPAQPRKFFVEE